MTARQFEDNSVKDRRYSNPHQEKLMKNIVWTVFCVIAAAAICSAQTTTFYFPQVADGVQADGTAWQTAIGLTNPAAPGSPAASGTITFTTDNGSPLNITLVDEQSQPIGSGSTIPFQIAGGQTRIFVSIPTGPVNNGFATVTSNLPITGGAAFYEYGGNGASRIGSAGVQAATPTKQQAIFVLRAERTAFAVASPDGAANITFQLLDKNGIVALPNVTKTLPAGNHTAFFVNQLFPSVSERFYGTVRITSDPAAIVGTALLFEDQFYTIPVFPLP